MRETIRQASKRLAGQNWWQFQQDYYVECSENEIIPIGDFFEKWKNL